MGERLLKIKRTVRSQRRKRKLGCVERVSQLNLEKDETGKFWLLGVGDTLSFATYLDGPKTHP